ncbi:DegV family EDD domain-containing protein [Alkalisalibacterium limincola]|uniref:DegV family EDD domain-containing protein n=1 Tax=Alkalisalibacterium limincola TaxID=2699169 RepID=A0A5C8KHB1_9GAMM|nr:DegV family EDD domain-containing protein [Alkalisalibacterium limincola]
MRKGPGPARGRCRRRRARLLRPWRRGRSRAPLLQRVPGGGRGHRSRGPAGRGGGTGCFQRGGCRLAPARAAACTCRCPGGLVRHLRPLRQRRGQQGRRHVRAAGRDALGAARGHRHRFLGRPARRRSGPAGYPRGALAGELRRARLPRQDRVESRGVLRPTAQRTGTATHQPTAARGFPPAIRVPAFPSPLGGVRRLVAGVSGTLQSGETAAAQVDGERVRVVDTANAAAGHALLVMAAAELAASDAGVDAVVAEVERLRPLTRTWAVARDISHAVRGGRVPAWARAPAELFGLAPIAHVVPAGRLKLKGAFFGTRRIPERLARYVVRRIDAGTRWRVVVGHGDCREDGEALLEALRARLDCAGSWLVDTGPAVGAHAGPGTLVVSVQPAS